MKSSCLVATWIRGIRARAQPTTAPVSQSRWKQCEFCRRWDLKPRRTIRIALWTGEEEGLLGSRAYVAQHFGKLEARRQSAASVTAPGGGDNSQPRCAAEADHDTRLREVCRATSIWTTAPARFAASTCKATKPCGDFSPMAGAVSRSGRRDTFPFQTPAAPITCRLMASGLPGFQFIQDEIEYDTRTHHSNQDVFDRIQADDMKQAATIMAAFVYNTAMRDEKLPRKPVPGAARTASNR